MEGFNISHIVIKLPIVRGMLPLPLVSIYPILLLNLITLVWCNFCRGVSIYPILLLNDSNIYMVWMDTQVSIYPILLLNSQCGYSLISLRYVSIYPILLLNLFECGMAIFFRRFNISHIVIKPYVLACAGARRSFNISHIVIKLCSPPLIQLYIGVSIYPILLLNKDFCGTIGRPAWFQYIPYCY